MTCRTDGSDVVSLTDTPGQELSPIWSPDGSLVAFIADYDGDFDLYVMSSDGTNVWKITQNSVDDFSPRWSPDGTRLAFNSDSTGDHHWEVHVIGVSGTGLARLTHTPTPDTSINPVWRPESEGSFS